MFDLLNTAMGSAFLGTSLGFVKMYMQMKHEQEIAKLKLSDKSVQQARLITNKFIQFLRMFVIIFVCVAYFSKPFLAAYMHWPMWISYTETHGWFVSFLNGDTSVVMKEFYGLVSSPTDNDVLVFIMTFLFGSVRVSR